MTKFNFAGTQQTEGMRVKIRGYIQRLPKEDEFRVPIKGQISSLNGKGFTYAFAGDIAQLSLGALPEMTWFTLGSAQGFYYEFSSLNKRNGKMIYSGIYANLTSENRRAIAQLLPPPKSKKVSLEFSLEEAERLLRHILI